MWGAGEGGLEEAAPGLAALPAVQAALCPASAARAVLTACLDCRWVQCSPSMAVPSTALPSHQWVICRATSHRAQCLILCMR